MTIPRWNPPVTLSRQEQFLMKRLDRVRKLFGFLRQHRHELFDETFQTELEGMYRNTGSGKTPIAPAQLAMASLLQGYVGASDAEAVELTVVDLRWQMVLGCLGAVEPAFSQGALHDFRHRMIRADLDRALLERTVDLARRTGGFDSKKLPKSLRVAMDSSPLEGAGRVEDTLNLIGHAARQVVACLATMLKRSVEDVCKIVGTPILLAPSIKAGLERQWGTPDDQQAALTELLRQLTSLRTWIDTQLPKKLTLAPELRTSLATLKQVIEQDLEPDPDHPTKSKIKQGVAQDRRVSIRDGEMRHGRKSKSKRFNGYKRHIAADLDSDVILSCAVTPANQPEENAATGLTSDIERQGLSLQALYIDRGYINAPVVNDIIGRGGDIICRPWKINRNANGNFSKADFRLNMRALTITCPAGQTESIRQGHSVEFDPETCDRCPLRSQCTASSAEHGRTISIGENERLQQRLRKQAATPAGRRKLRERVVVEHKLAHIAQRQGRHARYFGTRANLYDLRRASAIQNLETIQRKEAA
jgi:hypothetical protein